MMKLDENEIVIRHTKWGIFRFILIMLAFSAVGVGMIMAAETLGMVIFGWFIVAFFGIGGLCFLIFAARKPVVIVSKEGLTVPHSRGQDFIRWQEVNRLEVIVQEVARGNKQKYIGVFASDAANVRKADKTANGITKAVTGWKHVPTALINLDFTGIKPEKLLGTLQAFQEQYQISEKE